QGGENPRILGLREAEDQDFRVPARRLLTATENTPSAALPSSLVAQRTPKYASLLGMSGALHLGHFALPAKDRGARTEDREKKNPSSLLSSNLEPRSSFLP
ncbi:MAG: hypothetical protein ACM34C_05350, partial [Syntrophaceae bacterium]